MVIFGFVFISNIVQYSAVNILNLNQVCTTLNCKFIFVVENKTGDLYVSTVYFNVSKNINTATLNKIQVITNGGIFMTTIYRYIMNNLTVKK